MKKYTNKTSELRSIVFSDGSAQFLMRGQSITTDKEVKKVQAGITVVDVAVSKKQKKSDVVSGDE